MGLAIECAIVFFFENFSYTFGGKVFLQKSGGPIGARLTMAIARLIMQEWKDNYNEILKNSNIEELLSGIYVDDGRSLHRKLKWGERFDKENWKFTWNKETEECDKKEMKDRNELTRQEVLKAMNVVSNDIEFTMELSSDFSDKRLPTLSFSLWEGESSLEHSYFEKEMRNQTLLVERTSMSRQSIMAIMSNELVRRLDVLDENLEKEEVLSVVEKYIQQLVNSEFKWKQIRDIVVSGIKGFKRKEKIKKQKNEPRYRSRSQSLPARVKKKLCEKYNWFKARKEKECENEKDDIVEKSDKWSHYRKKKSPIKVLEKEILDKKEEPAKAIIFVQHTINSELAHEIKKVIQTLKPWTGINLKVVERAGDRIEDILHKSNPWENIDCKRDLCLTCKTSVESRSEKIPIKNCKKRSVVYETWCKLCEEPKNNDDTENVNDTNASDEIKSKKRDKKYG